MWSGSNRFYTVNLENNEMIENMKSISDWSSEVFPTLTKEAQLEKLIEEVVEFAKAGTDEERMKELADIYIVASILKNRFNCGLGWTAFQGLYRTKLVDVYHKVDEKMKINRKRKWEWNGKTYHHVEEK